MRIVILLAFLSQVLLFSCNDEKDQLPLPPSEWIVIGNDLGFRNEFVDMANVVRLRDSSLTVYSVAYPDVELVFPILDSIVTGGPEKRWKLAANGPDTLLLLDSVQNNRYHLLRLQPYQPAVDLWEFLTSQRFQRQYYYDEYTYVFTGSDPAEANCYVVHQVQTENGVSRLRRPKDGFWRLDQRFAQPLLLYTSGQGEHYVTVVDSLSAEAGIMGRKVVNSQPNLREMRDTLRPITEEVDVAGIQGLIDTLDFSHQTVSPLLDPATDERLHIAWSKRDLQEALMIADFEFGDLRIDLRDNNFSIATGGGTLVKGTFTVHPDYPYLVLNDGCGNENYLRIKPVEDGLQIIVPLRIQLVNKEMRPVELGVTPPDRVAYSENAAVFLVGAEIY